MRHCMDQTAAASTSASDPAELVARLIALLDVQSLGPDRFEGRRKPGGVGRVFGGQVIGQALAAAERTVAEDRPVHSLHAYFLRGGSEDHPIVFDVLRDFDGGSFSNRRVVASQEGRPILNMLASFHRTERGCSHADAMPEVPFPEDLPPLAEQQRPFLDRLDPAQRAFVMRPQLIELRPVEPGLWLSGQSGPPLSHTWFRAAAPLPADARIHRAVIAYASDLALLSTATRPHGLTPFARNLAAASLDHAIWFHDGEAHADEWLLYACDSPWAGNARGFNRGRIFTRGGRLVTETAQEGLIRPLAPKA